MTALRHSVSKRTAAGAALVALIAFAVPAVGGVGTASALLQSFSVSPSSGPPGTVVHVSGTGCSPGITLSPAQDYVSITSTTLAASLTLPVGADGSWSGAFTVPANAPAVPGLVLAVCSTNGLPSLLSTYSPHGFTVTAAPVPTTATTPSTATPSPPTTAATTTSTQPGSTPPSTSGPTHPVGVPTKGPIGGPAPGRGSGTGPGNGGSSGGGNTGGVATVPAGPGGAGVGSSPGATRSVPPGARANATAPTAGPRASAARLQEPTLASDHSTNGGGFPAFLWLVLLALVAGAGGLLWWWQRRENDAVGSAAETAAETA